MAIWRSISSLAAAILWHSYRHAETTILRQQMKWVTRGTILAIAPVHAVLCDPVPARVHAPAAVMKFQCCRWCSCR